MEYNLISPNKNADNQIFFFYFSVCSQETRLPSGRAAKDMV